MLPEINPPPETIENVPPEGVPTKVLVVFSQIVAVEVAFVETGDVAFTVKTTSEKILGQVFVEVNVYLIVTTVSTVILAGV